MADMRQFLLQAVLLVLLLLLDRAPFRTFARIALLTYVAPVFLLVHHIIFFQLEVMAPLL